MTTLTRPQRYQSGVMGRKLIYPVPSTQVEELGELLFKHGREIDWEFTPRSFDTELLHLTASDAVHLEVFNAAYLTPQSEKRIGKILGV